MITKTQPKKLCFLHDHNYCWACQKLTLKTLFSHDEKVCNACFVGDLTDTIASLEAEIVILKAPRKAGRPRKEKTKD